jgi:hypothetical protein
MRGKYRGFSSMGMYQDTGWQTLAEHKPALTQPSISSSALASIVIMSSILKIVMAASVANCAEQMHVSCSICYSLSP